MWRVLCPTITTSMRDPAWADENGDWVRNTLYLCERAGTISCGACPPFHQSRPGLGVDFPALEVLALARTRDPGDLFAYQLDQGVNLPEKSSVGQGGWRASARCRKDNGATHVGMIIYHVLVSGNTLPLSAPLFSRQSGAGGVD